MKRILFVCTGNICRSPTAEGVMLHVLRQGGRDRDFMIDSAGTHGYHIDCAPDPRTIETALRRGYDLRALRARQVAQNDFHDFDLILAMDRSHFQSLTRMAPPEALADIRMFMDYAKGTGIADVPDPYYGGPADFEHVLDLIEHGIQGLLREFA